MKQIILLICTILLVILASPSVYGWWGLGIDPFNQVNDHDTLTDQAINAVDYNDTNNRYSELYQAGSGYQDKIIDGAGKLDFQAERGKVPKNKVGYSNSDYSHFYNPNGSTISNQWPSALNESYDWLAEAISAYAKGEKSVAYTKLGYILHLLEDMTVPTHTFLILHGTDPWDYLEWQVDADDINAAQSPPIIAYRLEGNDLYAIEKQFNELARKSYNESDVQATIDGYYTDRSYIGSNFDCSLPGICSPQISANNVTILEQDLMPKAVQYSAGLAMRVYDIFQSLDWPTENHDYRRTGFTLLKGDMERASDVDTINFVLNSGVNLALQVVKSIVADIDGNGAMETVTLVHDTIAADRT
ncbi:MAG: hypothetical protein Q8R37_05300, partial [Nanoarchaeota archaeon]|nr:hypothetical protein [Nanoarchaeota archaeon]